MAQSTLTDQQNHFLHELRNGSVPSGRGNLASGMVERIMYLLGDEDALMLFGTIASALARKMGLPPAWVLDTLAAELYACDDTAAD